MENGYAPSNILGLFGNPIPGVCHSSRVTCFVQSRTSVLILQNTEHVGEQWQDTPINTSPQHKILSCTVRSITPYSVQKSKAHLARTVLSNRMNAFNARVSKMRGVLITSEYVAGCVYLWHCLCMLRGVVISTCYIP